MRLFHTPEALADYLDSADYEPPVDGIHLLQQYIRAPAPLITRAEFVGGRFIYAVEVDTSDGFELCPADACADRRRVLPGRRGTAGEVHDHRRHRRRSEARCEAFLAANGIEVAGIEFIPDTDGAVYTYDVNTNTNYNPEAEARAGRSGMTT